MVFFSREYPCDHYTSVINVTLLMTGCPRIDVHTTAVQLLQVLDKRFFGNVGPLQTECEKGKIFFVIIIKYFHSIFFASSLSHKDIHHVFRFNHDSLICKSMMNINHISVNPASIETNNWNESVYLNTIWLYLSHFCRVSDFLSGFMPMSIIVGMLISMIKAKCYTSRKFSVKVVKITEGFLW